MYEPGKESLRDGARGSMHLGRPGAPVTVLEY